MNNKNVFKRVCSVMLVLIMIVCMMTPTMDNYAATKNKSTKVTKVTLNKKNATIYVGKKLKLKAKVTPKKATNKKVSWKSSNKKVATVSSKGVVLAKKEGKTTITATAKDGSKKKASCKVTVKNPVKIKSIEWDAGGIGVKVVLTKKQVLKTSNFSFVYAMGDKKTFSNKKYASSLYTKDNITYYLTFENEIVAGALGRIYVSGLAGTGTDYKESFIKTISDYTGNYVNRNNDVTKGEEIDLQVYGKRFRSNLKGRVIVTVENLPKGLTYEYDDKFYLGYECVKIKGKCDTVGEYFSKIIFKDESGAVDIVYWKLVVHEENQIFAYLNDSEIYGGISFQNKVEVNTYLNVYNGSGSYKYEILDGTNGYIKNTSVYVSYTKAGDYKLRVKVTDLEKNQSVITTSNVHIRQLYGINASCTINGEKDRFIVQLLPCDSSIDYMKGYYPSDLGYQNVMKGTYCVYAVCVDDSSIYYVGKTKVTGDTTIKIDIKESKVWFTAGNKDISDYVLNNNCTWYDGIGNSIYKGRGYLKNSKYDIRTQIVDKKGNVWNVYFNGEINKSGTYKVTSKKSGKKIDTLKLDEEKEITIGAFDKEYVTFTSGNETSYYVKINSYCYIEIRTQNGILVNGIYTSSNYGIELAPNTKYYISYYNLYDVYRNLKVSINKN